MSLFGWFTKKTSVDVVLKTFNQTIADLKEVEQNNINEATAQEIKAREAQMAASASRAESERALAVREKIEAIIA